MADVGDTSDGYHTFNELYEHRTALFLALCATLSRESGGVWRSKLHSDGTKFDGWFIMGIGTAPGEQITYHLPIEKWDQAWCAEELPRAPEFDGHTPADVVRRLTRFLK